MSKTPRTDDQAVRIMFGMLDTVVPVEFARQLETELAEARAEIERKNALIEQMREALRLTADEYSLHVSRCENRNAHDDQCYIVAEQALAAERGEG